MGLRISGTVLRPDGVEEVTIEKTREARGFGRWIYCKYCYKNTRPELSSINQIVCAACGYGLSPDFFSMGALKLYMKDGNFDKAHEIDIRSKEHEQWQKKPFFPGAKLYRMRK